MKAMIFAAGLGTRLRPYTDSMPKAMVPVCGKPMLWHQVQKLKSCGVDYLIINVHHFASQIIDYVHSENDFGIQVHFSDESDCLLDTGGGLLAARKYLEDGDEPFLVHNVDIFSDINLKDFITGGIHQGCIAKLLVSERDSSRKLIFDEAMQLCGWKNCKSGELKGPVSDNVPEHGEERGCLDGTPGGVHELRELAFGGVHLISPEIFKVFDSLPQFSGCFSIIPFYLEACRKHGISAYCPEKMTLIDAGKVESLSEVERLLTNN